jgi:hypothetical protein
MNGEGDNNTTEADRIPVTRFSINLLPMERDLDTSQNLGNKITDIDININQIANLKKSP